MIQRPGDDEFDPYYARYVTRVPEGDIVAILKEQIEETTGLLEGLSDERAGYRYEPGKWSVREVVGHITDAERIFTARALRFGRNDPTPLPSFDENAYVAAGGFDSRALSDLVDELRAVRRATVALYGGLSDDAWLRAGTASNARVTVRGLAFIIAGHELHHRELLHTRYGLGGA